MKFCILTRFQNEAHWLRLHTWFMSMSPSIDGIVGMDGGSSDNGVGIFWTLPNGGCYSRDFDWDFSAQSNHLIECAKSDGYTHGILLDPDEVVSYETLKRTRESLEMVDAVVYDRVHFVKDRATWVPSWHPDRTMRAFNLEKVHYVNRVHEVPKLVGKVLESHMQVHHFGWIEPIESKQLQLHNYELLMAGKEPVDAVPAGAVIHHYPPGEIYTGQHIISPHQFGMKAPFK